MRTFGAFLMLQNTMLGPGLLSLPFAVASVGYGLGALLFFAGAALCVLSLHLLAQSSLRALHGSKDRQRRLTLSDLARAAEAGKCWEWGVDIGNFVACIGAMGSAMIGAADQLGVFAEATFGLFSQGAVFGVIWLVWVVPLSFAPNLSALRFSASLCLAVCVYLAVLVPVVMFFGEEIGCPLSPFNDPSLLGPNLVHPSPESAQLWPAKGPLWVLRAIPIFTFCFCAHMTMAGVTQEFERATIRQLDAAIIAATGSAVAIFGAVAFVGYLMLGQATPQDVMLAMPECAAVSVGRFGITLVCLCFFPLLLQAVRSTVVAWVHLLLGLVVTSDATAPLLADDHASCEVVSGPLPGILQHLVTAVIAVAGLCVGLFVHSLGLVISVAGASGFVIICYIFPARCYMLMYPDGACWYPALALLLTGVLIGPLCVLANFL